MAGGSARQGSESALARYNSDGSLDTGFGTNGQLTAPTAAVSLALGTPVGAAALTVSLDYTGTTQFAGEATTSANSANGYASGTLIGTQIDDSGAVMANYSNGQKQRVGTVALATFPDEGALVSVSGTRWTTSNASGIVGSLSVASVMLRALRSSKPQARRVGGRRFSVRRELIFPAFLIVVTLPRIPCGSFTHAPL